MKPIELLGREIVVGGQNLWIGGRLRWRWRGGPVRERTRRGQERVVDRPGGAFTRQDLSPAGRSDPLALRAQVEADDEHAGGHRDRKCVHERLGAR